jgi:hypothetical protein
MSKLLSFNIGFVTLLFSVHSDNVASLVNHVYLHLHRFLFKSITWQWFYQNGTRKSLKNLLVCVKKKHFVELDWRALRNVCNWLSEFYAIFH